MMLTPSLHSLHACQAVGFDGAVETIHSMVSEAKKKAGVPESHLLESLVRIDALSSV